MSIPSINKNTVLPASSDNKTMAGKSSADSDVGDSKIVKMEEQLSSPPIRLIDRLTAQMYRARAGGNNSPRLMKEMISGAFNYAKDGQHIVECAHEQATTSGHVEMAKLMGSLTLNDQSKNTSNEDLLNKLVLAVKHNNTAETSVIKRKIEISYKNQSEENLLHLAVQSGSFNTVKLLLESSSDLLHHRSETGETPLHIAATFDFKDIVTLLLENGANINIQDNDGETVLMTACMLNNNSLVSLLLTHGANPDIKNEEGKTAFKIALEFGNTEAIKLLT